MASGVERYVWGRFHNLLTANQSSVETDITGFGANNAGVTLSRDTTTFWQGTASLKAVCDGTLGFQGPSVSVSVTAGKTYTASVYLKGSGQVRLEFNGAGASNGFMQTLTGAWVRHTLSVTPTTTGTLNFIIHTNVSAQAITFWCDGLQLEQGSTVTDWRLGGTGKAVMVEEGTTNLFTNGGWMDGTLTGWGNYVTGGATGTRTVEADSQFTYRLNLNRTGQTAPADRWAVNQNKTWATSPGIKPTISFYLKVVSASAGAKTVLYTDLSNGTTPYSAGSVYVDLTTFALTTGNYNGGSSITAVGGGWYRVVYTHSMSDITGGTVYFWIEGANAQVYLAWSQFEAKAYATTFTPSTTTRAAETLAIPTTGLSPTQGTWEMWVRLDSNRTEEINLFRADTSSPWTYRILRYTNGTLFFSTYDGATTKSVAINNLTWHTDRKWHYAAVSWQGTSATVVADSVSATGAISEVPVAPTAYLGGYTGNECNGPIDEVRISTVARSASEMTAHASATSPPAPDANTLALLHFDGSLASDSLWVNANFDWNGGGKWNAS